MRVKISGWRHGFTKEGLTQTSRTMLGLSSQDAERLTELVSNGKTVELSMPDETGRQYVQRLRRLRVLAELLDE